MKNIISKSRIFAGLNDEELDQALLDLQAYEKTYLKDDLILRAGSVTDRAGMVMEGSVTIESNDLWGNRTILNHVAKGDLFAESYALLDDEPMLVDVRANEDCKVLFLSISRLKILDPKGVSWEMKMATNLLKITSQKNFHLSTRSFHTSHRKIRAKVMAYLNSMSLKAKSNMFTIPYDRQQMADYLNVDRTALSKELSKMKKEGLIDYKKNRFKILR